MSIKLATDLPAVLAIANDVDGHAEATEVKFTRAQAVQLLHDVVAAHQLHGLINTPHTDSFLEAVKLEAAHQCDRFGVAHDRSKSAENWFWLVGYLAGKCLRACVQGDRSKALHHTISTAAALQNWHAAIHGDTTGTGLGEDADIKPIELARFEDHQVVGATPEAGTRLPVVELSADLYSGR